MDGSFALRRPQCVSVNCVTTNKTARGDDPTGWYDSIDIRPTVYRTAVLVLTCANSGKTGPLGALFFLRATHRPIGRTDFDASSSSSDAATGVTSSSVEFRN